MSTAVVALIAYAALCVGGMLGWIARGAVVREQIEEPSEFATNWLERRP